MANTIREVLDKKGLDSRNYSKSTIGRPRKNQHYHLKAETKAAISAFMISCRMSSF